MAATVLFMVATIIYKRLELFFGHEWTACKLVRLDATAVSKKRTNEGRRRLTNWLDECKNAPGCYLVAPFQIDSFTFGLFLHSLVWVVEAID